jgi:hypothetical protein
MNEDLESKLRAALRPLPADENFARRFAARVSARRRFSPPAWWIPVGLAASVMIAIGVQRQVQQSHERADGLEARREVVEALRVTSQKLNLAYEVVKSQSSSLAEEKPGV